MDREKLHNAIRYAQENPTSSFSVELKKRIQGGEYNEILKKEGVDISKLQPPKEKGFLRKLGEGLIKSETEFGKSIAGAIDVFTGAGGGRQFEEVQSQNAQTTQQLISAIKEKEQKGEDASRFRKILKDMSGDLGDTSDLIERQAGLSTRQVLGQAGGVGLDILGSGAIGGAATRIVTKPATILGGALRGAGQGALVGGSFGAGQGLARGAQEDQEGAELLTSAISGGLVGGVTGGVLGGVTGGISGELRGRALRKEQLLDELTNNPDLVARYNLSDTGKILDNKAAKEVLRQGVPEKYVAVVKNANPQDKEKFREMFVLAEKASKDARAIKRPSDIVGETIVQRTKHLLVQLKKSGQQVDVAAKNLKGQRVNPQPAVQTFIDDLSEMGVTFKRGKPVFDGSDIQGITPAENLIKRVVQRANTISDDAAELHQLKKFIDEQVTFGRTGEGLSGQTERVLKGFRARLDGLLDSRFAEYDTANTGYKAARELLDATKTVVGRNFNPNEGSVRAGAIARRILGNSANRGDILEYLNALEKYFKSTGGKSTDDVISQTVFADILEDTFGTQATTGFSGGVQRGIEQAGGVIQDIGQGQLITGITRGAVRTFQATRGISDEAKRAALKVLIGL